MQCHTEFPIAEGHCSWARCNGPWKQLPDTLFHSFASSDSTIKRVRRHCTRNDIAARVIGYVIETTNSSRFHVASYMSQLVVLALLTIIHVSYVLCWTLFISSYIFSGILELVITLLQLTTLRDLSAVEPVVFLCNKVVYNSVLEYMLFCHNDINVFIIIYFIVTSSGKLKKNIFFFVKYWQIVYIAVQ